MTDNIFIIQNEVLVHKSPYGKIINEIFSGTNLKYYISRNSAVKELDRLVELTKTWILDDGLHISSIQHENIGSDTEFYLIRVEGIQRPLQLGIIPLEPSEEEV